jgi:LacI family transcriptional regulator
MIVQGIHPDVFAQAVPMKRAEADAYCVRLNGRDEARREMLEILSRIPEPVVLIQESLPVHDANRCVVRQDDHGGGLMLADHFAARGVRRLVVASPRFSGPMTEARLKGLDDGFRAAQAGPDVETLQCPINSFASAYETIGQRLDAKPPPQAILGTNDDIAYAAMRALQDRGIRVPDDVLVAGFNGFQPQAYTNPSLTTVVSQAVEIGATAGQCLLERLATGRFPRSQIVLPVSFRRGGST